LREIERKRKVTTKEVQDETRCRVVDSISGAYEYIDIDSYCKIEASEYEARYFAYLAKQKLSRDETKQPLPMLCSTRKDCQDFTPFQQNAFDMLVAAATSLISKSNTNFICKTSTSNNKRVISDVYDEVKNETALRTYSPSNEFGVLSDGINREIKNHTCCGLSLA